MDEIVGTEIEIDRQNARAFPGEVEMPPPPEHFDHLLTAGGSGKPKVAEQPRALRSEMPGEHGRIGGSGDAGI